MEIKIGKNYTRSELEDYILGNNSMIIELDITPGIHSCVGIEKLEIVEIYNKVNQIDLDYNSGAQGDLIYSFRNQVIIVKKVK